MRCCVPSCHNTSDAVSTKPQSKAISFHAFPSEVGLRAAWLRALGKQDSPLPDSAVVCSQHFLDYDICETESGLRQLATGAVPSTVQVCMICLDIDSRLFLMNKHKMEDAYEKLTGYPPCDVGNLKQALCIQCAQRLRTFSQFRDKSLRARAIMMDLVEKHELITRQHIKMINRTKNKLDNNFVVTTLGPDPCDLYIQEHPSEEQHTDSEAETLQTVEVKKEGGYDSMSVDEDTAGVNDDSNAEYVNDEFIASNDEYLNETKDPLKYESALFQCALCYEQFDHEYVYMKHMSVHNQASAGDGERAASPACEARTAASSSCPDTSLRARHGQKLHEAPHPTWLCEAVLATPAGPLQDAAPATNYKIKLPSNAEAGASVGQVLTTNTSDAKSKPIASHTLRSKTQTSDINVSLENNLLIVQVPSLYDVCQKQTAETYSEMKTFTCKYCQKKFRCNLDLNTHLRTHTGEKPYSCKFCDYKCVQKSNLVRHIKIHTGEKPFSCQLCKYRCAQNSTLVNHMRIHTGVKPYKCNFCNYKSVHQSNLVRHLKTHAFDPRCRQQL